MTTPEPSPSSDTAEPRHAEIIRQRAIEASANAIVVTSATPPEYIIEYVNPAFERITGFSAAEAVGRNCRFLQGEDADQPGLDEIRIALREQREGNAILRNYRKDKSLFWNHLFVAPVRDAEGTVTHFVASQYDLTATKELEERLLFLATHDELTGLPNRALLRDRLSHAMSVATRTRGSLWCAFFNIDRFKAINDSIGHGGGDEILRVVAARLTAAVRESDTVARWGGNEFAILMAQPGGDVLGIAVLERIIVAVNMPINFQGHDYELTCSMGVAAYPQEGETVDSLLQKADLAATHAKTSGANCFRFYTPELNERAQSRLRLESDLRLAIKRNEFVLHYQPQIDGVSGRIIGTEALVRWQHPERGLLGPFEFIPVAEETGLIGEIGEWVLRTACSQNVAWQRAGLPRVRMAVNVSSRQFANANLAASIEAVLRETGHAPGDLELELTESMIMRDVEQCIAVLRTLKQLGVKLAVDDFGTGYSSLSYLKRFPIDVLKIDRSFVSDIEDGKGDDAAIVASIIALAHILKLTVVAEGVETAQQLAFLKEQACDDMQGYYFSKPVGADAFAALLAKQAAA